MKRIILALAATASVGAAHAQSMDAVNPNPVHFMMGIGLSAGGDALASANYTNGGSATIRAGGGVYFTAGLDYRISPEFSVQGTLNFHVDDTNASNGDISFKRFPAELLVYFHPTAQWRVGGGVRYVSGAKLSSGGVAAGINQSFDNTTSGVVEGEYLWTPRAGVKVRYVSEKFKATGYSGETNANHLGISLNYYF
jgi:hypothetical protein